VAEKSKDYTVKGTDGKDYSVTVVAAGEVNVTSVTPKTCGGTEPPIEPIDPVEPPAEGGTIPMSFDDPMFDGCEHTSDTVRLEHGQNLSNTSIEEYGDQQSVLCLGNNKLTKVRVKSRECIRITEDDLTIENAYLESKGEGEDHADTLQAYSPGTVGGSVTLINTHVRAFNQAATAGYFTADNWDGKIIHRNVLYQGGPFGLRAIADFDTTVEIYMDGVYFVGPFGYEMFSLEEYDDASMVIKQWRNVFEATIQNGKLVPGREITMPGKSQIAEFTRKAPPRPKRDASTGFTVPK